MPRKLTISLDDDVYAALSAKVGEGSIGRFLNDLAKPIVSEADLRDGYQQMAGDAKEEAQARERIEPRSRPNAVMSPGLRVSYALLGCGVLGLVGIYFIPESWKGVGVVALISLACMALGTAGLFTVRSARILHAAASILGRRPPRAG